MLHGDGAGLLLGCGARFSKGKSFRRAKSPKEVFPALENRSFSATLAENDHCVDLVRRENGAYLCFFGFVF